MASSTRARRAWLGGGSVFAVAALGWGAFAAVGAISHQTQQRHTAVTTAVSAVEVQRTDGAVHVIGTTDTTITIDMTINDGLFSPRHSENVEGGRLVLRSDCNFSPFFCSVDYTIHMPRELPLAVHSSGGNVTVDNVDGSLDLTSSGGGVHVTGGLGDERLSSSGGSVSSIGTSGETVAASSSGGGVHLSFRRPPTSVSAGSSGGGVTVELPNTGDAYNVQAGSSGGGVHTPVRTDPSSSRTIKAHSSGGGVTVRYSA